MLKSEAGADRLRERARSKGLRFDERLLVASPPREPEAIDIARVPELLRAKLDAHLVEHDGGATTLEAFLQAGAISQLNLTLMRGRSVRDVVESTPRLDAAARDEILRTWDGRARAFPSDGNGLRESWTPVYAIEQAAPDGEAVVVVLGTGSDFARQT